MRSRSPQKIIIMFPLQKPIHRKIDYQFERASKGEMPTIQEMNMFNGLWVCVCVGAYFYCFFPGFPSFFPSIGFVCMCTGVYGDTYIFHFHSMFSVWMGRCTFQRVRKINILPAKNHTHKHEHMKTMLIWLFSGHRTKRLAMRANDDDVCAFSALHKNSFSEKAIFSRIISLHLQKHFVLFSQLKCENWFRADILNSHANATVLSVRKFDSKIFHVPSDCMRDKFAVWYALDKADPPINQRFSRTRR